MGDEYQVYVSGSKDFLQAMLDDVKFTFSNKDQFTEWSQQMGLTMLTPVLYTNNKQYIHLKADRKVFI